MGFGTTKGTSQQQSSEQRNYGTNVWGPQAGFLQDIYSQAQGMKQDLQGYAGQAGLDQMRGALGQSQQALMGLANPQQTDPLMGMYANQIGQQFNEQIAPGIRGDAMLGGNRGGSRQGIGLGLAGARAGQQLQDFGAQLWGQQQQNALSAAQGLQGVAGGYGQLAGQQGMAPWQNLQQYAGLIGGPAFQNLGGYGTSSGASSGGGGWNMRLW
jgi:hypothetical protein